MTEEAKNDRIMEIADVFIKKATENGYSKDVIMLGGILACGDHQEEGHEIETFEKFIGFIDESKDEDEFVEKATGLFDL